MCDLLDNKSDAEIEEIYNVATMEDLQSMLTQEKSLNRRRLLRKVIRNKTANVTTTELKPVMVEITRKSTPSSIGTTSSNTVFRPQNPPGDLKLLEALTNLQKELSDETDLTKRRLLRKEIQGLEDKCNSTKKNLSDPPAPRAPAQCTIPSKEEMKNGNGLNIQAAKVTEVTEKPTMKENLAKSVDKPATGRSVDVTDSSMRPTISQPTNNAETTNKLATGNKSKFNILHDSNSSNAGMSPSPSRVPSANIQSKTSFQSAETKLNPPVIKPRTSEEKRPIDPISSIQKTPTISSSIPKSSPVTIADKPINEAPKTLVKGNVSRVNSVKQMFESPPIISAPQKRAGNVKTLDDDEINNLVNQALNKDKAGSSQDKVNVNKLALPQATNRKTSQTGIIMMIPQWKKMAQTARSSVQAMKEQIIAFCQHNTKEYQNVNIVNYSKSWADGLAFCALIHHFYPDSFDFNALSSNNPEYNFKLAFDTAQKYAGIEPLMDPEDMMVLETPDQKCVYTYVQFIYHALKNHPKNVVKRIDNDDK